MTPESSLGFSAAAFAEDVLGVKPLPWQRWLLIHALELSPDRRWRFRTVLVMVARQNGKTTIVEVKNLWKLFVLRVLLVIGTAQNLDIAEESWDKAVEIVEGVPELNAEVAHTDKTNGKKALRLDGGPRWKIAAASRKGGRGLSGDDVNLDELREHQNWSAWGAVTKTTMARPNPQVWAYSNAGDDKSVVLNELQAKGRAAAEAPEAYPTLGHFEWSAPDDVRCTCGKPGNKHDLDCRLRDRQVWAQANPSLGYTVTEEALESALDTDEDAVFQTECLCQHVRDLVGEWTVVSEAAWRALADPRSQITGRVAFAVDVTPERDWASIAAAGLRADGLLHVEVVEHRRGTEWVPSWLDERVKRWDPCAVVIDKGGPAASVIAAIEAKGVEVHKTAAADMAAACGALYDRVADAGTLRHLDQLELNTALAGAIKRDMGDGAWGWTRKGVAIDISPLVAVTLAAWGFGQFGRKAKARPLAAWV